MVTLQATKDAFTDTSNDTFNYGSCPYMKTSVDLYSSNFMEAYIEFDVSAYDLSGLTSAELHVYFITNSYDSSSFSSNIVRIYRLTESFVEGTQCGAEQSGSITDDNKPSYTLTNRTEFNISPEFTSESPPIEYSKDVTAMVNDNSLDTLGFTFLVRNDRSYVEMATNDASGDYGAFIVLNGAVLKTDYYLSTSGSDSNSGTSWDNAWKTLLHASNQIQDGQTLHIEYGNYTEYTSGYGIEFPNIGSSGIKLIVENTDGTQTQGSEAKFTLMT